MPLFKNAFLYPVCAAPFVGDLLLKENRIAGMGSDLESEGEEILDCTGKFLLPGFIDAHCHIGMWENGIGEEGADGNECTDPVTPFLRAIDGLNPFDGCFREAVEAGITTVATGPGSANVIGGQFCLLKTAGRELSDRLVQAPIAMKAALGENPKRVYGDKNTSPMTRMAIASLFRKTFLEAQLYGQKKANATKDKPAPDCDPVLECLLPVLEGTLPLKIHVHRADDILTALRLAEEFHIKASLEHCTEGYLIADILKEKLQRQEFYVILGPLLADRSKVELRMQSLKAPGLLYKAGIPFALMTDHPVVPIQYLAVEAAMSVREGLPEDIALQAITTEPARILGAEKSIGSLAVGKEGDLALFSDHPFTYKSQCLQTYIGGRLVYKRK